MKINTNARVTFLLTSYGRVQMRTYYRQHGLTIFQDLFQPITMPLWEVAHIWGATMDIGCDPPFENNELELQETP